MRISETNYQKTLFPYAYNILGSVDDAMDSVQDIMEKHLGNKNQDLHNESAYLIKSVINHAINIKKRQNRVVPNGVWLPEPVATDKADDIVNRTEVISYSMLVLLEHLNPKERAVFILKEAYDYSHEEIAATLSISVDNSRKLLSRAKKELNAKRSIRTFTGPAKASSFLQRYIDVIKSGDTVTLVNMLSNEISVRTDGGEVKIVNAVTAGVESVMSLILYVYQTYQKNFKILVGEVNHEPALFFYEKNILVNCQVFELAATGDCIENIYSIVDPLKLKKMTSPDEPQKSTRSGS
jgi:RNA polymerase sigma-70 factor (ECF subfamily)